MENRKTPLVLIVDDSPENLKYISNIVNGMLFDYAMATNGFQLFEFLESEKPDLILLDVSMPEMDGYTICEELKRRAESRDIPVVFITGKTEIEELVKGFTVGGIDYITKPFNSIILKVKIRTYIELKQSRDELKEHIIKLQDINVKLHHEKEHSEFLANRDPLTGTFNRRYIVDRLKEEQGRFIRNKRGFAVAIIDIDDFTHVNDTYGHAAGDRVLKAFTKLLYEHIRTQDSFARWGGEEFFLLLPETDLEGAMVLMEKLREIVENQEFQFNENIIKITFTCGVSEATFNGTIDNCIVSADKSLYRGKYNGKNQIVCGNKKK